MGKKYITIAGISGILAVALGAFGAHFLKEIFTEYELSIFKTGVQYQFYHSLALLGVGIYSRWSKNKFLKWAGWFFVAGMICFSGSLYLLSISELLDFQHWNNVIGPFTPIGGLLLIFGWAALIGVGTTFSKK